MHFYFFILCSLLSYKSAVANISFNDSYERADVKIRYDRGFVDVIAKNDKIINNKYLTKGMKIKLSGDSNLCISFTDASEFRIEGINDSFQSYAIDSDKAVSIAGDNYTDKIAIKSKSYIANIGNVIAQAVQFFTAKLWNFGGLGEKANFDCTPKVDATELDSRDHAGFNNLGTINFDEIKVRDMRIHQCGRLITNSLTQERADLLPGNDFIISQKIGNCNSNCEIYTQINKLEGTDRIVKCCGQTAIIKNFMGSEISTKPDGSFSCVTKTKRLTPDLTPKTSRRSCGIPNLRTTCHYNAALQTLYALDTLRDKIFEYNGHDRFILAFKKIFSRLQLRMIQESDIIEFLKEIYGEDYYTGSYDFCADLEFWIPLLSKAGLNANIENIFTQEMDNGLTFVDNNVFFLAVSDRSPSKISSRVTKNKQVSNIGDYVILLADYRDRTSYAKSQEIDDIILEGNRYQPIAAISENSLHCWATVKQLDGTFIQYNDANETRVSEFDNLTSTVLYKRIPN